MGIVIEGEPAYPIYLFIAKWHQPASGDAPAGWLKGLPLGRMWNTTSLYKMFKEEPEPTDLDIYIIDWWTRIVEQKKHEDYSTPILTIKFLEHETWCLDWFQHHTFDVGQTNDEALESFGRFVLRKKHLIREKGESAYCLMGAEDRWRWSGSGASGDWNENTTPPCRCIHCKEQGVIRIGH